MLLNLWVSLLHLIHRHLAGTSEVTLLELTSAYNVLANNGNGVFSYGIRSIEDTDGEILFSRKLQGTGKVLESSIVSKMTRMMEQTIESGTGRNAKLKSSCSW